MNVNLTSEQQDFITRAIQEGRLRGAEEALQEAMALWTDRERARAELIASLDEAEASIDRGEGIEMTPESLRALAESVKRHVRARLATDNAAAS